MCPAPYIIRRPVTYILRASACLCVSPIYCDNNALVIFSRKIQPFSDALPIVKVSFTQKNFSGSYESYGILSKLCLVPQLLLPISSSSHSSLLPLGEKLVLPPAFALLRHPVPPPTQIFINHSSNDFYSLPKVKSGSRC